MSSIRNYKNAPKDELDNNNNDPVGPNGKKNKKGNDNRGTPSKTRNNINEALA